MISPPKPGKKWVALDTKTSSEFKSKRARFRADHPTEDMKTFAEDCKELRTLLGLTQTALADKLEVKGQSVSRWERVSGHMPSKDTRAKFYKLLREARLKKGNAKPNVNPSRFRRSEASFGNNEEQA